VSAAPITEAGRAAAPAAGRRRWMKAAAGWLAGGFGALGCDLAQAAGSASPMATAPSSAPATPVALDDRMPAFWRAYDASLALPPQERAQRLVREFFSPAQALYARAGSKAPDAAAAGRWLARFDPIAPDVRAVSARVTTELPANLDRFRAALPDFDPAVSPIAVLPSLFAFDAHLEPGGATLPLFFGPDGIVRYHGTRADLDVLFSHEIFHCYQAQRNPALMLASNPPVYGNLWIEGVATWASGQLNPGASLLHVLLDDEALFRDGPRTAPRVAAAMLARLDATDDATLAGFFGAGQTGLEWPSRAGYYVGYLAARRIGAELSMREMAALPMARIRERVVPVLQDLRDGSGVGSST